MAKQQPSSETMPFVSAEIQDLKQKRTAKQAAKGMKVRHVSRAHPNNQPVPIAAGIETATGQLVREKKLDSKLSKHVREN